MNLRKSSLWLTIVLCLSMAGLFYYEYDAATNLIRFRKSDDPVNLTKVENPPSMKGFSELNISGSCRPTIFGLKKYLSTMDIPVYVFDLMGEDHYYIEGMPERWYGYHYNTDTLHVKENRSIRKKLHSLLFTGKLHHEMSEVQTEKELVEGLGLNYVGIKQTRKASILAEQVDHLIETFRSLPNPSWIHFHCSAGRGRTTIAMVMYDILNNGREVSLEDIIKRHQLIGSEDLFDTTVWPNGRYTKEMLEERKQLIVDFYAFVNDPQGLDHTSWADWKEKH